MLDGSATVLIKNGRILDRNLSALRMNLEDLTSLLRGQGAFTLNDVEFALLEPTGNLSVLLKSQYQPITPSVLNIPTKYHGLAHPFIMNGSIADGNLRNGGLTTDWLVDKLR